MQGVWDNQTRSPESALRRTRPGVLTWRSELLSCAHRATKDPVAASFLPRTSAARALCPGGCAS